MTLLETVVVSLSTIIVTKTGEFALAKYTAKNLLKVSSRQQDLDEFKVLLDERREDIKFLKTEVNNLTEKLTKTTSEMYKMRDFVLEQQKKIKEQELIITKLKLNDEKRDTL